MQKIKEMRERKGITQEQLANEANVSRQYIHLLETGKREECTVKLARRIAKALECDWTELYND